MAKDLRDRQALAHELVEAQTRVAELREIRARCEQLTQENARLRRQVEQTAHDSAAQGALKDGDTRLRQAIEVAELGTYDYYPQTGAMFWSDRAKRHFGLPPEAPVSYDLFLAGLHPDDREYMHQAVQQALHRSDGRPFADFANQCRTIGIQDRQHRWLTTRWRTLYDQHGHATRITGTTLDITDRQQAEEALMASEERFRTSVESMLDGFGIYSAIRDDAGRIVDFRVEYVNQAGCLLNRLSREQQIGQRVLELWPHLRGGDLFEQCRAVVETGTPLLRESARQEPFCGSSQDARQVYDLRATRLGDGFAAIWRDMTQRKRIEQQLRDLNDTLERRVAERTAIAEQRTAQLQRLTCELSRAEEHERRRLAQILHDHLQQLLVGAKFSISMLRGQVHEDALRQSLRQIDDLLNDSITASRSLTVELSPPILNQGNLASALHWLGRWMEEKHGLVTEIRADEQANPQAEETRSLLFQAVRELLLNVIKHAGVKRAIVEMHATDEHSVRIVVADTGVGFDPVRAGGNHDPTTGFGLLNLQERLSLMGGRMDIESAPGQGTRITLLSPLQPVVALPAEQVLPAAAPSLAAGQHREILRQRPRGKAIRVLLADDHDVVRNGLARLLQAQPGIQVIAQASDGQMAVDLAMHSQPDVIVMDVSMPRLDGVEATRRITAQLPKVRVIGLSMHGEGEVAERMRQAGAVNYLAKSSAPEDLIAAIRACKPEMAHK